MLVGVLQDLVVNIFEEGDGENLLLFDEDEGVGLCKFLGILVVVVGVIMLDVWLV